MIYEIIFRTQYNSPYLEFSKRFGKHKMVSYAHKNIDFIIVEDNISEIDLDYAKKIIPHSEEMKITKIGNPAKMTIIELTSYCNLFNSDSISSVIQEKGGIFIFPTKYKNGWEYHKIICSDQDIKDNIKENVLSKRPSTEILKIEQTIYNQFLPQVYFVSEMINELTQKQLKHLILAFQFGYYQIPRSIQTKELAKMLGISRYTFEKSLRTAENKLIQSILPYISSISFSNKPELD